RRVDVTWWRQRERERDVERELRSHLELEAEEQQEAGLSREEARYAARRALGNATRIREDVREIWTWTTFEQAAQDVRYALRGARNSPGFTLTAVLSLALGIGATTAVFSVLNAALLRPLAVPEPERLVLLRPELRGKRFVLFNPLFEELRGTQRSLTGMFAVSDEPYLKAALDGRAPEYVRGSLVSGNYFHVLGVSPAAGRLLTPADDEAPDANCTAVVSHAFWMTRLHGDPEVLGRPVVVREKACTIAGVASAAFGGHDPGYAPDLWLPLRPLTDPKLLASRSMAFFSGVMGRLRPDTTAAQAETELTALYRRLQAAAPQPSPHPGQADPKPEDFRIAVAPGAQGLGTLGRHFGRPLAFALAIVGVVLLIACVNVSNLLLARGASRTTELATRAALGAGRSRLARLLAIEGAVFAGLGGVLGVAAALLFTPALGRAVADPSRLFALDTTPDARVLAVAVAATMSAALLAGILPALRLSGPGLQTGMAGAGRATASRTAQRLTRTLVAAQLALSLLLVTSAGLLLRTMVRVMGVDPGFNAGNVVLMDVRDTEPAARFGEVDTPEQKARRAAQYRALDQRLNAIPGVRAASLSWLGLFGRNYVGLNLYDVQNPEDRRFTLLDYISSRYFEAVGMQIVRGRGFTDADREGSTRVAVVNEAFARERIRGGQHAIGRSFVMTYIDDRRPFTIVGIVRDAKYNDVREAKTEPMMWVPLAQAPFKITSVSLRVVPGADTAAVRETRAAIQAASPHLMIRRVTTLRAQVDQATARERLLLYLASGFGGLALLLAAVGLYGTLAYSVARRTREIGVRLALGAQRAAVLRLVIGDSLRPLAGGILAGIPLSVAAGSVLRTFLFSVTPYDVPTLIGAGTVLGTVAITAAFAPARRASRIDPMAALKYE
ncbi:MAG TPA: ABC transporter permease, partial [Bryobacteraceae bacterium]|nr:ABC transporter permease [Bryobacteraceae bacterium]